MFICTYVYIHIYIYIYIYRPPGSVEPAWFFGLRCIRWDTMNGLLYLPTIWYQAQDTKDVGTKQLVPSTWYQILVTEYLVPSTWYQLPGTKYLVPSLDEVVGEKFGKGLDTFQTFGRSLPNSCKLNDGRGPHENLLELLGVN